jgi:hypothetical protein
MRGTAIVIAGLALALLAASAFAQSDDWEQVPSESGHGAASALVAKNKGGMACTLVATMVEQAAKLRDTGVTEESQLANVDSPNGTLSQLSIGSVLSADSAGTLRAGIHRQIDYVYEHREMTPAQLGTRARQTCGNPGNGGEGAPAPVAHPTRVPSPG